MNLNYQLKSVLFAALAVLSMLLVLRTGAVANAWLPAASAVCAGYFWWASRVAGRGPR